MRIIARRLMRRTRWMIVWRGRWQGIRRRESGAFDVGPLSLYPRIIPPKRKPLTLEELNAAIDEILKEGT